MAAIGWLFYEEGALEHFRELNCELNILLCTFKDLVFEISENEFLVEYFSFWLVGDGTLACVLVPGDLFLPNTVQNQTVAFEWFLDS